jgi:hypothetical protein
VDVAPGPPACCGGIIMQPAAANETANAPEKHKESFMPMSYAGACGTLPLSAC